MTIEISHLASVHPQAKIAEGVTIGPFCSVGPDVALGSGTRLDSHVVITGHTRVGRNNRFWPNCVIGAEPQDYSYTGAPTRLEIGDGNIFREGVTVHRGAEKEDCITRIGHNNMFMANAHVAHNCHIHDHVVLVNGVLLGGHVHVHDRAIISGNSVVHHFASIGTLAFISGGTRVPADVPPYMLAVGSDHCRIVTVNLVGLQRRGIPASTIAAIKRAHRLLYREHIPMREAKTRLTAELSETLPPEIDILFEFIGKQQAGKQGRAGEARRGSVVEQPTLNPAESSNTEPLRRSA